MDGGMQIIPKILHQAWVSGDPLKDRYFPWRLSWIEHNPSWTFMFWDMDNLPFEKFSPSGAKLMDMKLKFGVKSDIVRWELLYLFGGVWADMDTECRKPMDQFLENESFAGVSYHPDGVGNAVIGSIAGTDFIKEIRDATNEKVLLDIPGSFNNKKLCEAHGATFVGSNFLCRVKKIYPRNFFYPYHPKDSHLYRVKKVPEDFPDSSVIHKWEGCASDGWAHVDY
jgi:hypothetical protein